MEDHRWPVPETVDHQMVDLRHPRDQLRHWRALFADERVPARRAGFGLRITMTLSTGVQLIFGNPQARRLPANDLSALKPGTARIDPRPARQPHNRPPDHPGAVSAGP